MSVSTSMSMKPAPEQQGWALPACLHRTAPHRTALRETRQPVGAGKGALRCGGESHQQTHAAGNSIKLGNSWAGGWMDGWMDGWGRATLRWDGEWRPAVVH